MLRTIICLFIISIFSLTAIGQVGTVTASYENTRLSEALRDVRRQGNIRLAYDTRKCQSIFVSVNLDKLPPPQALEVLLQGTGLRYEKLNNVYLIVPIPPAEVQPTSPSRRNFSLNGRVKDADSGEALPYASVFIRKKGIGVMTEVDGTFRLTDIPIDTLSLCVSYLGYKPICRRLYELDDNVVLTIERSNTYLLSVDIIGRLDKGISLLPEESVFKLEPRSLSQLNMGYQGDVFRSMQMLPGVSSNDDLDARLNIRGSENDENLVLWDGFTIYHLDHLFGVFSTMNPLAIQDIQIHRSAYGSRFGNRSGGVLEITGSSGATESPQASIDLDLIDAGITVHGPVSEKHSYLIAFRRSHYDVFDTQLFDEVLDRVYDKSTADDPNADLVFDRREPGYIYYDFNFKWKTRITEKDALSLSVFNGRDLFDNSTHLRYQSSTEPRQFNDFLEDEADWGNLGLGATWTSRSAEGRMMHTSLGYSDYHSRYFFSDTEQDFLNGFPLQERNASQEENNNLKDLTFSHRQIIPLSNAGELEVGYQGTRLQLDYELMGGLSPLDADRKIDSSDVANIHSIHAERRWKWNDKTHFRFGGRLASNDYTDKVYVEPRIGLHHSVSEAFNLRIMSGNYIQTIRRVAEQNLFVRQPDRWMLSDGGMLPESRAFHTAIGAHLEQDLWELDAEVYYKQLKGVILNLEQTRILSDFTPEEESIVNGEGEVMGMDAFIRFQDQGHDLWVSYSLTLSENRIEEVNDGETFPSIFNRTNDFKTAYSYRTGDYRLSSTLLASSGYPYTPLLGTFEGPGGDYFIVYGKELSDRLPSHFSWDARVERVFHIPNADLTLGIGLLNITDHRNIRSRNYVLDQLRPEDSDKLRIKAVDLELLGRTPNFSLVLTIR